MLNKVFKALISCCQYVTPFCQCLKATYAAIQTMHFSLRTLHILTRQGLTAFCTHHNRLAVKWRVQVPNWPSRIPEMSPIVNIPHKMKNMNRESLSCWEAEILYLVRTGHWTFEMPETGLFASNMFEKRWFSAMKHTHRNHIFCHDISNDPSYFT